MDYSKFFGRLAILFLPFAVLGAFVAYIDPFCLFRTPFIAPEVKQKSAFPLNICLAKLIEFQQKPSPNILLGDSRMGLISSSEIEDVGGPKYLNMSYGGASLNEEADTFWTANESVPLKSVVLGIGFSQYNDYNFTNRTEPAMAIIDSPLLYFTNRTVLKAAWYTVGLRYFGSDPKLGQPRITREQLWAEELQTHSNWSERYLAPTRYHARLEEIARYSHQHGIDLRFLIYPGHADLQAIPHRWGRDREYLQFKRDLARMGRLYDFDVPNELTSDADNYKDPVHFRQPIARRIIAEIWGAGTSERTR